MSNWHTPGRQGLYDPVYEHDACGVGAICRLDGEKSHDVIEKGLEILLNLTHRGACGCDAKTGDGAGILMQVPHTFLSNRCGELGIRLPDPGEYGAGLVFLPRDDAQRKVCIERFEATVKAEGQQLLGWRDVPTNAAVLGEVAREVEPVVRQIFVGRGPGLVDSSAFERKLFVIRKVMERAIRQSDLSEKKRFYVPSLSCRRLVYKGLLLADQVPLYYPDLTDPSMVSGLALVHQRYSTNTFPTWDLAQPFRFLCHNGEINTLRGNVNWMQAREALFESPAFGDDMAKLFPIATPGASDSAILDNAIELLYHTGRSLPHAVMMLIPEAWQNHATMSDQKKAFYEYHSCLTEPWDGPASIPFSDGQCIGAVLDRNGLRPSRYLVTKDGYVVMGSETGVLDVDPANVKYKGRLQPGRMFLVSFDEKRIIDDEEIKETICRRKPYRAWLDKSLVPVCSLQTGEDPKPTDLTTITLRQRLFGYTLEDLAVLIGPMASDGKEPIGSMGNDAPLAVLSQRPQLLYNYFKQLFAQVTNPPLDAIREQLVTSLVTNVGAEKDLFEESDQHCRQLRIDQPVLTNYELEKIRAADLDGIKATTLDIVFPKAGGTRGLERAMDALCARAAEAVRAGCTILVLSDRRANAEQTPIPALLAVSGVHHHLIREGLRTLCGIILESGEPREVHHYCLLAGYGCGAVNPYLALETIEQMVSQHELGDLTVEQATKNYIKAVGLGMLKTMSKMGISTLHSYRGAQIFEAVGLARSVIDKYFTWTPSRIQGIDIETIAEEALRRHANSLPEAAVDGTVDLSPGGQYAWRRDGEYHQVNPLTIATLQESVRKNSKDRYEEFSRICNDHARRLCTLRGLMDFKCNGEGVPLDEVEPWTEIVKRFKTGAMSYGSISEEAHSTLAIAMNRLGGRSNSGEGGEDPKRYKPDANGDSRCSAIKQVASGRFGVTIDYLVSANELQIKMALSLPFSLHLQSWSIFWPPPPRHLPGSIGLSPQRTFRHR